MNPRLGVTNGHVTKTALERWRDRVAFVQDERKLTYAAVADLVGRMGRVLAERGFHSGAGLAMLSGNTPEAWIAQVAAGMLGGRNTALHPLGSLDDHSFICDEAEIHTLVYDPRAFDERAAQLAAGTGVKQVLALGPSQSGENLIALTEQAASAALQPVGAEDDVASVLYTGGTTGRPKGVVLPHRSWTQVTLSCLADFQLPHEVRYLAASPISHAAGMMVGPTLIKGGTVHLHPSFDPERYLAEIASSRITLCFGVPTMIYALLDHPALRSTDVSSLETFLYAASPMSPARLKEAMEVIGPVFTQYYGQTESAGQGTVLTKQDHDPTSPGRLASCGKPMSFVHVQIQDDDGNEVAVGETGEICVRCRGVMDGYWKNPELTEETLRGGWLHTGDMATRDEEGFLTIVDRRKDMIVSGGFNVFPREIEDVLTSHASVAMAAVIGVPDDKWGEAVKAVVVLKPGASAGDAELIALVKEKKGPIYAPKSVEFVDALPLTPLAKADKKALRARYWSGAERAVH